MALFCVIEKVDDWRYDQWGLIYERNTNRVFVVFEPGSGKWYDVFDVRLCTWDETPDEVIERYFTC